MLETYSSLVFLGHCIARPEVIFKLERGAEPRTVEERPKQNSDVQIVNDIIERNLETHGRHLWQVVITNSKTSTEERVELGKTFKLRSHHIPNLMINNGNYSGMKSEVFNICQNVHVTIEPHEMQAREKPDNQTVTGKSLTHHEHRSHHHSSQTGQQLFESSGQGKIFNTKAILFIRKKVYRGETAACK
ncbi:zinc finger protein 717-like [Carlito syrichta]|uniref:Zinc finger protein 717-like n=1 Tax=Carlito syrichta TaxID=1868482 RepID=A0A3Q0EFY2_CARSF|nr:zinc finger protein 717-like [Carlito syrichta]